MRISARSLNTCPHMNGLHKVLPVLPIKTRGKLATSRIEKLALDDLVDDITKITHVFTLEPDPANLDQRFRLIASSPM